MILLKSAFCDIFKRDAIFIGKYSVMEETTDLFGIQVPSTNKVFLTFVVIHILISLVAVISGFFAMLSDKSAKRHSTFGSIYFWSIVLSFTTVAILSFMRWWQNIHLFIIGILTITLTYIGYRVAKSRRRNWTRLHTICMGFSYILLLTGFYVDNGKNLPFWNQFPPLVFYVFPSFVGIPIIVYVLIKHPLNKKR